MRELGAGAMATVWLATDTGLGREVAIKVLHAHYQRRPELIARLAREGRAAAGLDHPNVLKVHDVGDGAAGGPAYLVLELVRGRSLRDFLDDNGPPLAEVVAAVGVIVARALAAAHAAGVVHRDLKPANVLVSAEGRLVLADFGMARVLEEDATLTASGALLGTPAFMSPEQALGQRADARSDLYGLGASLYQLATGALPVSGSAGAALAATIRGDIVPPLRRSPRIGRDLARVIERLMAREPAARPADAAAAARELEEVATPGWVDGVPLAQGIAAYFADPGGWNADALPRVLASTLARAREAAARGEHPRASALLDRVLAFDGAHAGALELAHTLARGRGRRRGLAIAGGAALAIAAAAGGIWAAQGGGGARVGVAAAAGLDASAPGFDAAAAAAAALADPVVPVGPDATRAPEPAIPTAVRAATSLRGVRPAGTTPRPSALPPDAAPFAPVAAPLPPDAAPPPGSLIVKITPWCDLRVDGVDRGRSPLAQPLELSAGPHALVCANGQGHRLARTVTVRSGQTTTVAENLIAPVVVTVDVAARIDGVAVRKGDKLELTPGRHRVEIIGGATSFIDVPTRPCRLKATPDPGCY